MANVEGLRVTVQGDLPGDVMEKITDAVRQATLAVIAELDMAPSLNAQSFTGPEVSPQGFGFEIPGGLVTGGVVANLSEGEL
ncbi:hypothetical protein [Streptomyces sp. MN13]